MPRYRRKISAYAYYHVMIRGVNRMDIFNDDNDRIRFIDTMRRFCGETKVDIIVYCLMRNHVHILTVAPDGMDLFMKKLLSSYVYYFNHKYDRIGHLFQDRYKSEAVESDSYLLTAARYILQNPQKAGICKTDEYPWSSWNEITSLSGFTKPKILYDLAEGYFRLEDYLLSDNEDICLDVEKTTTITDADALGIIQSTYKGSDLSGIKSLPLIERNLLLQKLKEEGLSARQISLFTGLGRNIIQRA